MAYPIKIPMQPTLKIGRFAYTLAVIIVYLLVVGVAWFLSTQIMGVVQAAGRSIATNLGTVDNSYVVADQFLSNVFMGFLVIGMFALAVWVYQYSQKVKVFGG
jgi:hypothetical protein